MFTRATTWDFPHLQQPAGVPALLSLAHGFPCSSSSWAGKGIRSKKFILNWSMSGWALGWSEELFVGSEDVFLGSRKLRSYSWEVSQQKNHIPKIQLIPAGCEKKSNFEPGFQGKHHHNTSYSCCSLLFPIPSLIPVKEGGIIN